MAHGVWEMTVKMRWGVSDTSGKRSGAELESKWFFCPPGALTHEWAKEGRCLSWRLQLPVQAAAL